MVESNPTENGFHERILKLNVKGFFLNMFLKLKPLVKDLESVIQTQENW
jgi:hypothetical protein